MFLSGMIPIQFLEGHINACIRINQGDDSVVAEAEVKRPDTYVPTPGEPTDMVPPAAPEAPTPETDDLPF